ncbi:MAG: transporter substrate-binding domain-containing protein [Dialister sp.]|nr:transporter substrate-binding domain-containing protein [Dialister sp.]
MKKSLKMVILGMAAVSMFALAGCGDSGKTGANNKNTGGEQQGKLLKKIKERGKLIVGTSSGYPPYVFVDATAGDKKVIGLDVELAQQVANKLGVKLEVQDMSFSALLSSVTADKVDIAVGGVAPTPEREKAMAFSKIYLPTEQKLLVRKEDAGKYKSLSDLKGAVLGAEKSTTQEATAQKVEGAKAVGLTNVPDAVLELKHGKLNGIVMEGVVAKQYLIFNDDLALAEFSFPDAKKVSAIALQKGNDDLVKILNEVIDENTQNGNFEKWVDQYSKLAVEKAK